MTGQKLGRKTGLKVEPGSGKRYPYKKFISLDKRMVDAIDELTKEHGICFSDVVRQCLRKSLNIEEPPVGKIF